MHPWIRADIVERGLITYDLPVEEVLVTLARTYLLTGGFGNLLLCMASATKKRPGLPSWCPDWTSKLLHTRLLSNVQSYRASGHLVAGQQTAPFSIGYLQNSILVRGFTIDVVDLKGEPLIIEGNGELTVEDDNILRRWEERCRSIACSTITSSSWENAYLRTLTGNVWHDLSPCTDDIVEPYYRWRQSMGHADGRQPDATASVPGDRAFRRAVGPHSIGRQFFSTESRRIGMGPQDLRKDDLVCILFCGGTLGSCPWILRRVARSELSGEHDNRESSESTAYQLIGNAYVDGLMNGEALMSPGRGNSTEFLII